MLAVLLEIPRDKAAWNRFSFHHRQSHDRIVAAINAKGGQQLVTYQLDPINPDDFESWITRHQQAHVDMDGALGAQGVDLSDLDPTDERQLIGWIYRNWEEHTAAENALGISS